jgi:hypothetical protein
MSTMRKLALSSALVGAVALAGCAQQRAPVNRVQPDALDKTFFVGKDLADTSDDPEFYMRTTIVDAPYGAADGLFTSSYAQPLVRIRWQITEDLLLARLSYELINDSDYHGVRRSSDGQIVAAFKISKHFDIQHDYNTTTGELLNVIVENDTDRPWYQRAYMRVDWSANQVTDAYQLDTVSQLGIIDGVKFDPVAYYVNDPSDPNYPVFDTKNGYFDVTHKALASPQLVHVDWWDADVPACWFPGKFPVINCNPSEITLRTSFLQVVDKDYEPVDWDGVKMDITGLFTNDRYGYDRRYGVVDNNWHRFGSRWNIWQASHANPTVACNTSSTAGTDPHLDADNDGTEDQCAAVGRGSRCDEFRGECTIPFRDRQVKTIPWHVNAGFPDDLFGGTAAALNGWSDAIRVGVLAARLSECRRTKDQNCEQTMGWPMRWADDYVPPIGNGSLDQVPKVFVLCHNPVDSTKGDDAACGPDGTVARLGDLRYNFINVVDGPQTGSPWGIMVDGDDPLTGEKVSGSVNEWGAVLDLAASNVTDLVQLLNGDIDPTNYIKGQNVSAWVASNQPKSLQQRLAMSAEEAASRRAAFDPSKLAAYSAGLPKRVAGVPDRLNRQVRAQALADRAPGSGNADILAQMQQLRGTPFEAMLVTPEIAQEAGFDPTGAINAGVVQQASPLAGLNPAWRRQLEHNKLLARVKNHSCQIDDFEPDNLLGMAQAVKNKFPSPDPSDAKAVYQHNKDIWNWARQNFSMSVLAHEMGHSMGLRHNFAGSFDALNYHPQYWQLRTNNAQVTKQCSDGTTDGSDCVGPRWRDPETVDEINNNIGRYAMTTVMDYPGDQNQDMMLQGKYDKASMRFVYGGVNDVWVGPSLTGDNKDDAYKLSAFASNPGLFGVFNFPPSDPTTGYEYIHYSQYQNRFHLISNCSGSSDADAMLGMKCQEHEMDVVDYRDLADFAAIPDFAQYDWAVTRKVKDPQGRVRRGYMFSSDEFADTGNVPSFRFDSGADSYEQIRFLEQAYENRYIVDGFRRNRVLFNTDGVVARMQARYLNTIQALTKTFAFAAVLDGDPLNPSPTFLQDGNYGPLQMGSTVSLDLFARLMTRPQPGYFCNPNLATCPNTNPVGVRESVYSSDDNAISAFPYSFHVALGEGRYVHNDYDYGQGYWWADYQTQVGAFYEKAWATFYVAEAFDDFVSNSKQDFTDGRYKNLNFATVYPDQVRRLFGGLMTGDVPSFAPSVQVATQTTGTPEGPLVYPTWHAGDLSAPRPTSSKVVDPNWAWEEQLWAMIFGAVFFPTDWSNSWIHDGQIAVLGADQPNWSPAETFTFYNPKSGLTYKAHSLGSEMIMGQQRQISLGARMLEWANNLTAVAYQVQTDLNGNPLFNADGTPKLLLDANGKAQLNTDNAGADAVLQKYVDNVDLFRQLTSKFFRPL